MKPVPDSSVADAILRRVNAMNLDIGFKAVTATAVLALLPEVYGQLFSSP